MIHADKTFVDGGCARGPDGSCIRPQKSVVLSDLDCEIDESRDNRDPAYQRSRLRHTVLPALGRGVERSLGRLVQEARLFLESVEKGVEPPVLGVEAEMPQLAALYPDAHQEPLWDVEDEDLEVALQLDGLCDELRDFGDMRRTGDKGHKAAKVKLLAITKDRGNVRSGKHYIKVTKGPYGKGARVTAKERST